MKKPHPTKANLFIVGAPKCGTTAWVNYLQSHPDIFFSPVKEPVHFAFDLPGVRFVKSFAAYQRLFANAGNAKVIGEASTPYFYSTDAAQAIAKYNPEAKIIVFLRAQEDFLPSLHHQFLYSFEENIVDFEKAWRISGRRPPETIPAGCRDPRLLDYATHGRFHEHLQRYLRVFPREQIRVIRFDKWTSDPRSTYLGILDFLGVEDDGRTDFPRLNEAKTHRSEWLGHLIMHPPKFAMVIARLLKSALRKPSLGVVERAAKLIEVPGYRTSVSDELREEIRLFYKEENQMLADAIFTRGQSSLALQSRGSK